MTVALGTASSHGTGTGNFTPSIDMTGVRGLLVGIAYNGSTSDQITSVDIGGVALTRVTGSPYTQQTSFNDWWLVADTTSLTGSQTLTVTVSGATNKLCVSYRLTGGNSLASSGTLQANTAFGSTDNLGTINIGGNSSFIAMMFMHGESSVANIAPITGWTGLVEFDWGPDTGGSYYVTAVTATNQTVGIAYPSGSEKCALFAVGVYETAGGGGGGLRRKGSLGLLGVGR